MQNSIHNLVCGVVNHSASWKFAAVDGQKFESTCVPIPLPLTGFPYAIHGRDNTSPPRLTIESLEAGAFGFGGDSAEIHVGCQIQRAAIVAPGNVRDAFSRDDAAE